MALNATPAVYSLVYSLALTVARRGPNRHSSRGSLKGPSLTSLPRRSLLGSIAFHSFMLGSSSSVAARSKLSEAEQLTVDLSSMTRRTATIHHDEDWWLELVESKSAHCCQILLVMSLIRSQDTIFYSTPRFVTHIDDPAIQALTKYYASVFPPSNSPGVALLDMCSSWISHYPKGYKQERIAGLGLNEEELTRNPVLTEYLVQDLNQNTALPYDDSSFDIITNAVSVDYMAKPLEVFKEMRRVLKPGGLAIMSFSNRCFWTKAISIWTGTGDVDHVYIVGSYFHYAGGYEPPQALDISPNPGRTDPMYVVFSRKVQA